MKKRRIQIGSVLVLALVVLSAGCEDSDVTAPTGSIITLTPQPASVNINQQQGETKGSTTLVAQVVDAGGLPLDEIPLFFTTTGGILSSVTNVCSGTTCTRTPQVCSVDADCDPVPPLIIETNASGVAIDTLTLRLIEDPNSVTVTVKGTNLEAMATVEKNVNLGPADPVAVIAASPTGGQRTGLFFSFNGAGSTFDPNVELTCFQWTISASGDVFDASGTTLPDGSALGCGSCTPSSTSCTDTCVSRDAFDAGISLKLGNKGDLGFNVDLSVELKVSDEPSINCANPAPGQLSINEDTLPYQIRCDFTPPTLASIGDVTADLAASNPAVIGFSAQAFDLEDNNLDYTWNCGTGATAVVSPDGKSVSCSYSFTGSFAGSVTVQNECGLTATEGFSVQVVNSNP